MKNELIEKEQQVVVPELIEKYLQFIDVSSNTERTYNVGLKQYYNYLIENNIQNPTRETIINFREYLLQQHKPNTVNSYLIAIRNFYQWLEYEDITKDISKKIKGIKLENIHLKRGLSIEEIQRLINCCEDIKEEVLVKLMLTCGLRVNEVRNIQLEDFYRDGDSIMLKILGKGRAGLKQDVVKVDYRLFELIQRYIVLYHITDYLFVSNSNHNKGGMLSDISIRRAINRLFKKANIDDDMITPHSIRHTTVEQALESGHTIHEVSEFIRHKSIETTMRYSRELDKRKCNICENIGDLVF